MSDDRQNQDRWLRELAQVSAENQQEEQHLLDERWDRLSHGELTTEEEAELRALAGTSEEAHQAHEAFRPLGPDFQAGVVQAIRAQAAAEAPAKLLPFPWRRAGWSTAAALAAAAVLVLVFRPQAAPLPGYTAELTGGARDVRGETGPASGLPVFGPGSLLTLVARPEQPVAGALEAQAFAARGAEMVPLDLKPEIGSEGSVRIQGPLDLPPGDWRIWLVFGRKGRIPPPAELAGNLGSRRAHPEDWQAVSADVRVEGELAP